MDIDLAWRRRQTDLTDLGTSVRLPAGTRLITEGRTAAEFFVVEHGHVSVHRGGREVAVLGPGEHFGEIALLRPHTPRTASVTAVEDIQVHVFDRREFATLLRRDPEAEAGILRNAVERLLAA